MPTTGMSRIARAWRDGGLPLVVSRAARTVLSPVAVFGHVEFFVKDLRMATGDPAVRSDGVVLGEASPSEASSLLMGRDEADVVADEVDQRFERGDRCIVARDADGDILHSRWVSTRPTHIPEIDACISPRPGQIYMYDGYTRPEARGRGIDGAVRSHIFETMANEGFDEVVSYVRGANRVGLIAARKWQRSAGTATFVRFGNAKTRTRVSSELAARVDFISMAEATEREAAREERQRALRDWFNSWLVEGQGKRSTGCSALPPEYFASAGRHIVETLEIDPAGHSVLDVGCSSGGISRHVAPFSARFVGVDMTAGLVEDIPKGSILTASGTPAEFSAADGRALPFDAATFDRVYCTGVIHVVPERGDAMRIVDELVRVCKPGGTVLVGAVPDEAKRWAEYRLLWRRADLKGKVKLVMARILPAGLRRALKRTLVGDAQGPEVAFLKFDFPALCRRYEARGIRCEIRDYPSDYWSEDFRTTRSNLLLRIPNRASPDTDIR